MNQLAYFDSLTPSYTPLCVVCHLADPVETRICTQCGEHVHHMCSNELAQDIGVEFEQHVAFCDNECYNNYPQTKGKVPIFNPPTSMRTLMNSDVCSIPITVQATQKNVSKQLPKKVPNLKEIRKQLLMKECTIDDGGYTGVFVVNDVVRKRHNNVCSVVCTLHEVGGTGKTIHNVDYLKVTKHLCHHFENNEHNSLQLLVEDLSHVESTNIYCKTRYARSASGPANIIAENLNIEQGKSIKHNYIGLFHTRIVDNAQMKYVDFDAYVEENEGYFDALSPSTCMLMRDKSLSSDFMNNVSASEVHEADSSHEFTISQEEWHSTQLGDIMEDKRLTECVYDQYTVPSIVIESISTPFDAFTSLFPLPLCTWISKCSEQKRKRLCHKVAPERKDSLYHYQEITTTCILRYFGLLLLNMMRPSKEGMAVQWSTNSTILRPSGIFSTWMPRDKFRAVGRYLSFSSESGSVMTQDRHYKLRTVIAMLNESFKKSFTLGKFISFDEATFACVSKYLPGKVYNPMKPHRYGLKVFMTCCAQTEFCSGFELYQGKDVANTINELKTGPAALLRAMEPYKNSYRCVVVDRYYASVVVFEQLLQNGLFAVGTIHPDRLGYPKAATINKNRSNLIKRGSMFMQCKTISNGTLVAVAWRDTKAVHVLSTGLSNKLTAVTRWDSCENRLKKQACCESISTYQKYMGGVDQSDNMRMAHYSLQKSYHARKWYKSIFLSLFDLAMTNAYILHNTLFPAQTTKYRQRSEFIYGVIEGLLSYNPVENIAKSLPISKKRKPLIDDSLDAFSHHEIFEFSAKVDEPKKGRRRSITLDKFGMPILYGHSGSNGQFRPCVACTLKTAKRVQTKHYCSHCRVAVCNPRMRRFDDEGQEYDCWSVLHNDSSLQSRVHRKVSKICN